MCNFMKANHDNLYSEIGNIGKDIGIPDKNITTQDCNIKVKTWKQWSPKLTIWAGKCEGGDCLFSWTQVEGRLKEAESTV